MNLDTIAPEDIVDGFVLPAEMTPEQRRQADQQLATIRQKSAAERSEQDRLYGQLLQLKIQIEAYINQDSYDPKKNFAHFLKSYIELQHKKKQEVATELDIHQTKLSQLLSGHRAPSDDLFIRLEFHSNQFIPARAWFRLSVKEQEYAIMTNTSRRIKEKQHVKGQLNFEF